MNDLRYYAVLSAIRTPKYRKELNNPIFTDPIIRKMDKIDDKKIQLEHMKRIIDDWENNKDKIKKDVYSDCMLENIIKFFMESKIIIIKFDVNKLFLAEPLVWGEESINYNGVWINQFMAISPNLGLLFLRKNLYSLVFDDNFDYIDDEIKYLDKKLKEINPNKNDEFTLRIVPKEEKIADSCNAMILNHSKNNIVIYQNYDDFILANVILLDFLKTNFIVKG